jgi:hypothetical protein
MKQIEKQQFASAKQTRQSKGRFEREAVNVLVVLLAA